MSKLLIEKFFGAIIDSIEEIDTPFFKGFCYILLILILIALLIWLVSNLFGGNWKITAIIFGILVFIELCNWIGGGWQENE